MNLVIIEGVGKKDTIKKYLGKDFQVFATKGHVRDLPAKTLAVNTSALNMLLCQIKKRLLKA